MKGIKGKVVSNVKLWMFPRKLLNHSPLLVPDIFSH